MSHYFEKTIVDAKDIYTNYLINIISPLLYNGLKSMYDKSVEIEKKYIEAEKKDPNLKNPGCIILFQHFLMELEKMSDTTLEEETKRFRDNSGCADIFDDLIKSVIKSNIIVLTYTASNKSCKIVKEKFHEKIDSKMFINKCYLECIKLFFDHPMLFYHKFQQNEIKDNQRLIYQLIKVSIKNAVNRCLPMKDILFEYLNNDYQPEETNEYIKVRDMLRRDLTNNTDDGGIMKILDSDSHSFHDTKIEINELNDITSLIYNRKIDDTLDGTFSENKVIDRKNDDQYNILDDGEKVDEIEEKVIDVEKDAVEIEEKEKDDIKNNITKIVSNSASGGAEKKSEYIDIVSKLNNTANKNKVKDMILQDAVKNAKTQKEMISENTDNIKVVKNNVKNDDDQNYFGETYD